MYFVRIPRISEGISNYVIPLSVYLMRNDLSAYSSFTLEKSIDIGSIYYL